MIALNFLHPYPRYGVAAALVELAEQEVYWESLDTWQKVSDLAWQAIDRALNRYTLHTNNNPELEATTVLEFSYLDEKQLDPGKRSGQIAAKGYYLAPHVITTDGSSAATVVEARAIRDMLKTATPDDLQKTVKLKRSFAPLTSKINNGRSSMAEPKATLLEAAFTVITTLTEYKPAAQVAVGKGMANTAIIPDLPLAEDEYTPLIDFVQVFFDMRLKINDEKKDAYQVAVNPKDRKYRRPPLFRGNYKNAPRDGSLGAISLIASIGAWARQKGTFRHKLSNGTYQNDAREPFARKILSYLQERPLYILSYEEVRQESYGHHLVSMAIEQDLTTIVRAAHRSMPFGIERIDDPQYRLYKRFFDRFLLQFDRPSFRDFMAARNEYSFELEPIFNQFMKDQYQLSPELIASARAYGQSLNYAAYVTAEAEKQDDIKNRRRERPLSEYKNRILVQFESTILSAKTPTALLSQMGIIVGRLTGRDIDSKAAFFMETAAAWPLDKLSLVQELMTAFMRLSSYRPKADASGGSQGTETGDKSDPMNDEMPD